MIATRKTKGATMANDKQDKLPDTIEELVQMAIDERKASNDVRDQCIELRDKINSMRDELAELEIKHRGMGFGVNKAHRLLDKEIARRTIQGGIDG